MINRAMEEQPSPLPVKVHGRIYSELLNLVGLVSNIIYEIEDARPGDIGMQALGLLHRGIVKAKSLLQHCSESSVLYLVLTGEEFLSRCNKSRNLLDHCLCQLQNKVSVLLAAKIHGIILALRRAIFCLEPSEKKAGKVLWELLHSYGSNIDSTEDFALSTIHAVCSLFRISSPRALVVEKYSIKKQLDKFGEADQVKRKVLRFFLRLLDKYRKFITKGYDSSPKVEPQAKMLNRHIPPDEFICFLSSMIMHDPVVIASGETYERVWIKKWFDEGRNTCPKTKVKLQDFSLTENTGLRNIISKWCATDSLPTPNSTDSSSISDLSCSKNVDSIDSSSEISSISLNASCSTVENIRGLLKICDASWSMMPLGELIQLLIRYLKDARDCGDVVAQMDGCKYLLQHVQKHRNSASYLKEDAYSLLASFLGTPVADQALSVFDILSLQQQNGHKIAASGAVICISNILENKDQDFLEPALNVLSNLSLNTDIYPFITPSSFIPKLFPLLETRNLARYCVTILKNLSDNGEDIACIVEIDGCIASIGKLLEGGSHVEQECTLSILLSLCSKGVGYSRLIMDDRLISGLFDASINGNEKVKAMALRIIQILEEK